MDTKHETECASSPTNNDSDDDGQASVGSNCQEEEDKKPADNNVANILKKYSLSVYKKPKKEYHCYTCSEDFPGTEELHSHLIRHVSLPSVVLVRLPSDDEETPSGDENWSDEEDASPPQPPKMPQKIDISQILKKTGITLKKPTEPVKSADSALNKLSGLGFTIKKNNTPIKMEPELENTNDVMEKLGKLGGIKLKLKSDGNNTNSFKVINGLRDFNASDDENEARDDDNDDSKEDGDIDDEHDKSGEQEGSAGDNDSEGDNEPSAPASRKNSDSDGSENSSAINKKLTNSLKHLQGKAIVTKIEPITPSKLGLVRTKEDQMPLKVVQQGKPPGRPAIKQTPKRGLNFQTVMKETPTLQVKEIITPKKPGATPERRDSYPERRESNPERRESQDKGMEGVVVKQEVETVEAQSSNVPIFPGHIKSERASPTHNDASSTPVLARVKTEPDLPAPSANSTQNHYPPVVSTTNTSLLPVTKTEEAGMTIIEINGDSNDEDDDCCVVSATPAPAVKPKTEFIPKTENAASYPPPAYPTSQPSFSSTSSAPTSMLSNRLTQSTEKQHSFNWNAPDSKPPLDMLEKSADDIFESLLSNSTKKENLSLSDASEYISLDTLGPQHSCDVCNTRFTDISLLEEHRRMTGHSNSIVPVSSSTLLPYTPASNLLSSLLPVKQIADQVGKLSTITAGGPGFTHQQNVMINIQAYPGASGGVMMAPQGYSTYPQGQNVPPNFTHPQNNMYGASQSMPGQYPGQTYIGQHGYSQYQQPMSKSGYPGAMPQNQFPPSSSLYSTASPLQGMQQAVYGQAPTATINTQMGQMGPPGAPPYVQASSPGGMKPPTSSAIKIQNVQTFPPGQSHGGPLMSGQSIVGSEMGQPSAPGQIAAQMPTPSQIRMAPGANITGIRPRMATPRGMRPTIRPGIQVHSQVRGQKPGVRMPLKRPAGMPGGPGQKRRPDMLLPGKHDNEDCQVMAMQRQREGLPMIQSVQGAKDKLNIGSQISITKKTVNKEANAMANVLASRGISIKQKQKSRSPTPERPVPHIPNLGAGMSIKHTSKSSNFSIPEAKIGGGMLSCKMCKKMFMNQNSLSVHMSNAHPQSKLPVFKCDECPASYPKSLQLQHHKRVFHNVTGPNRELGLPVVDLSQEDNLKRLSNLGIYSFIPLANREQASGCFGIPVISVHNMQNGLTSSLQALGADGLLSLGPLKPLPNS